MIQPIIRRFCCWCVLVLAIFTATNLALSLLATRFDFNSLWTGIASSPSPGGQVLLLMFALGAIGYPWLPAKAKIGVRIVVLMLAGYSCYDAIGYYQLLATEAILSSWQVPFSLLLSLVLTGWALWPCHLPTDDRQQWLPTVAGIGLTAMALLLAQIMLFGKTDYRRHADAIVVFGAGVYADGSPSDALYDRTHTACMLYRKGLARYLVFSGGRNPQVPISEPEAMRRIAASLEIPATAILLDQQGVNTLATIANCQRLAEKKGWQRLLMVSHDYHLSRIKMLAFRNGLIVYTVPAHEPRFLEKKPYFVLREMIAWAYYWLPGAR